VEFSERTSQICGQKLVIGYVPVYEAYAHGWWSQEDRSVAFGRIRSRFYRDLEAAANSEHKWQTEGERVQKWSSFCWVPDCVT